MRGGARRPGAILRGPGHPAGLPQPRVRVRPARGHHDLGRPPGRAACRGRDRARCLLGLGWGARSRRRDPGHRRSRAPAPHEGSGPRSRAPRRPGGGGDPGLPADRRGRPYGWRGVVRRGTGRRARPARRDRDRGTLPRVARRLIRVLTDPSTSLTMCGKNAVRGRRPDLPDRKDAPRGTRAFTPASPLRAARRGKRAWATTERAGRSGSRISGWLSRRSCRRAHLRPDREVRHVGRPTNDGQRSGLPVRRRGGAGRPDIGRSILIRAPRSSRRPAPGPVATRRYTPIHPRGPPMFQRWGAFVYRHRRIVALVALVVAVVALPFATRASGKLSSGGWLDPASESSQVGDRLAAQFGGGKSSLVALFTRTQPGADATSAEFQGAIATATAVLRTDPNVTGTLGYAETGDRRFISTKADAAYIVINLAVTDEESVPLYRDLRAKLAPPAGYAVTVSGYAPFTLDTAKQAEEDLLRAELVSLPIVAIVLFLVFTSAIAAGMPLLVAGLAIPTSLGLVYWVAQITSMSIFVLNIASMLGLALAIDYSLFLVSRFREELARGREVGDAVARAVATSGKAV